MPLILPRSMHSLAISLLLVLGAILCPSSIVAASLKPNLLDWEGLDGFSLDGGSATEPTTSSVNLTFDLADLVLYRDLHHGVITIKHPDDVYYSILLTDSNEIMATHQEIQIIRKAQIFSLPSTHTITPKISQGLYVHLEHESEDSNPEIHLVVQVVEEEEKAFVQSLRNLAISCYPFQVLKTLGPAVNPMNRPASNSVFSFLSDESEDKLDEEFGKRKLMKLRPEVEFDVPQSMTVGWIADQLVPYLLNYEITETLIQKILDLYNPVAARDDGLKTAGVVKRLNLTENEIVTVVGDIHGEFSAILTIFSINGFPSQSRKFIFNGDFVDRGANSIECLLILLACKIAEPTGIYLNLGNHETRRVIPEKFARQCRLLEDQSKSEIAGMKDADYVLIEDGTIYAKFQEAFKTFNYAMIIQDAVFVTHGGLCHNLTLTELEEIDLAKPLTGRQEFILHSLLWNDPGEQFGMQNSVRGPGAYQFGPDITNDFLYKGNLRLLLRSHEYCDTGFELSQNYRCMTVFSAPNYCGVCGNMAAYVTFNFNADVRVDYFE